MNLKQNNIAIIAVGGGGSNILNSIIEAHPDCSDTMAINMDQVGLNRSKAKAKIKLKGNTSSEISRMKGEIEYFLKNKNGLIVLACLGGVTGNYMTAPIVSTAKALNIPVLAIVSLPFDIEGKERMKKAIKGLGDIEKLDIVIASFSNQQLMDMVDEDTSMEDALKLVDVEVWKVLKPYLAGEKVVM